jgi:hypothetical protein
MITNPKVAKAKGLERRPEFIEGKALRPSKGFISIHASDKRVQYAGR